MAEQHPEVELAGAKEPRLPVSSWAQTVLAFLAILYTLHYAKAFILPVVLALLLALLLTPLVQSLHRLGLPYVASSALVVFGLAGALGAGVFALSSPAWEWMQQAPQLMDRIEEKLIPLQRTVEEVDAAAAQVEEMADGNAPVVQVKESSLRDGVIEQATTFLTSALITMFLLFFLLAAGDLLLRNLLTALPTFRDKRRAMEIAHHLQSEISGYLFTITLINSGLAAVTSLVLWLTGMPNPVLWGVLAGLLNYVPYLGPMLMLGILTVVSALSFSEIGQILLGPLAFFVVTSLEGQMVTPLLLGRRLALNPIAIFLGLIFWGWLWGVVGALLAVPIMASIKIVCDHVEPLQPFGTTMGR